MGENDGGEHERVKRRVVREKVVVEGKVCRVRHDPVSPNWRSDGRRVPASPGCARVRPAPTPIKECMYSILYIQYYCVYIALRNKFEAVRAPYRPDTDQTQL